MKTIRGLRTVRGGGTECSRCGHLVPASQPVLLLEDPATGEMLGFYHRTCIAGAVRLAKMRPGELDLTVVCMARRGGGELVTINGSDPGTAVGEGGGDMTNDEMKRQYRSKQKQIRELEAERAAILGRGGVVPWRIGYRLEMLRIEAEELRMWGHRELVRAIRESTG